MECLMLSESKETPIKLWITCIEGRQPVLSVQCVLSVSVVSLAKVTECQCHSKKCLCLLMNVHQSDSSISSITCQHLTFSPYSHTNALVSNIYCSWSQTNRL